MKKELLLASALVGTVGLSGIAQAADMSMSGHSRNGVTWTDTDAAGDALMNGNQQSSLTISLSQVTDGGTTIATGFDVTNENDEDTDSSGLTFTFNSGVKLDVIEAGAAYATHLASVPSAAGEQGVAATTTNSAPSGLDYANSNDLVGFELHSAADAFGVDGLKVGVSASFNGDAAATTSAHAMENSMSVGVSYVSTAGDSTVTIGGGFFTGDTVATAATSDVQSTAMSITAVTGDLTVGLGYASGAYLKDKALAVQDEQVTGASVTTAGVKYVSGDLTFNLGFVSGEGTDEILGTAADGSADSYEQTAASVGYAIASGVSATIGYSDRSNSSENAAKPTNSGTSWYIGADVSF
jgi:hypothetical protein